METSIELVTDYSPLPLDQSCAHVYIASLAPGSRRSTIYALQTVAAALNPELTWETTPWAALRYQHVAAVRARLAETMSYRSVNKILCAVRGVLQNAWKLDLMSHDDYARAVAVKGVKGVSLPVGRAVAEVERHWIHAVIDANSEHNPALAIRDHALFAVFYVGFPRRSELVSLDLADLDRQNGCLRVTGKGNKERELFIDTALPRLDAWLEIRGNEPGPLFLRILKSGRILHERLTDDGVYWMLKQRAQQAGVENLSPHSWRRTAISDLSMKGVPLTVIAGMAGHSRVTTTETYCRFSQDAMREAARKLIV